MEEIDYLYTNSQSFTGATTNAILLATSSETHITSAFVIMDTTTGSASISCLNEYTGTTTIIRTANAGIVNTGNIRMDCVGNILYSKAGTGNNMASITYRPIYVPAEVTVSCIDCAGTTTILQSTSTNTPQYTNGFSYGEILIAFFLLILVTNQFFGGILDRLLGKKQRPNYKIRL